MSTQIRISFDEAVKIHFQELYILEGMFAGRSKAIADRTYRAGIVSTPGLNHGSSQLCDQYQKRVVFRPTDRYCQ